MLNLFGKLVLTGALAGVSVQATAVTFDFENENDLGVDLGGGLVWDGDGGGHLYADNVFNDDFIIFLVSDVYLNDFIMNGSRNKTESIEGFPGQAQGPRLVTIEAWAEDGSQPLKSVTVDLQDNVDWNSWETVSFEIGGVAELRFKAVSVDFINPIFFFPSIDNLRINEQGGDAPLGSSAVALFSLIGLMGLVKRFRK